MAGKVLDATGGGIDGAQIQIARPDYGLRPFVELSSNENGQFSASIPGNGIIVIKAAAPGYASAILHRKLPSTDATLQLMPESTIEGQVVDARTREPVAGVEVWALSQTSVAASLAPHVTSDASGRFLLSALEPGIYRLRAEGPTTTGAAPRENEGISVGLAAHLSGVAIPVHASTSLTGEILVSGRNTPCAQGSVTLGPLNEMSLSHRLGRPSAQRTPVGGDVGGVPSVHARTDARGRAQLRGLVPGHYYVTIECDGHIYSEGPLELDITGREDVVTWRVAAGPRLEVFVHDERGRPVADAQVALEYPETPVGRPVFTALAIGEDGRARVTGDLYPGRYVLHPSTTLGVGPREVNLTEEDDAVSIELTVPGSSALRVRVESPRGEPLDGVWVRARGSAIGNPSEIVRDGVSVASGQFLVHPLPPGEYTVEVDDGVNPVWIAEGPRGRTIAVSSGEEVTATCRLTCESELGGVVTDEVGGPVADAWVTVTLSVTSGENEGPPKPFGAPDAPRVLSDENGAFAVQGLCGDSIYRINIERDDGVRGSRAGARPGSGRVHVTAQVPGGLEGAVRTAQGAAVSEYVLTVVNSRERYSQTVQIRATDGRFSLSKIPVGATTLLVRSGGQASQMSVEIRPGHTIRGLDITLHPHGDQELPL